MSREPNRSRGNGRRVVDVGVRENGRKVCRYSGVLRQQIADALHGLHTEGQQLASEQLAAVELVAGIALPLVC